MADRHPQSDEIVRLAKLGVTSGQIAKRLEIGRNFVTGVIDRRLGGAVKRRATVARMHRAPPMKIKMVTPAKVPTGGSHNPKGCRWIFGDTRGQWSYCGAPINSIRRPYCEGHKARMYRQAALTR